MLKPGIATVRHLLDRVAETTSEKTLLETRMIPLADRSQPCPLSHAQERLWFLERFCPDLRAFNETDAVRLQGELDCRRLQEAINAIVARHESLRTILQATDAGLVQVVQERWAVEIKMIDLAARSPDESAAQLDRLLIEEPRRPFDLTAEPGVRATLIRLAAQDHVFMCVSEIIDANSADPDQGL
jgi:hypothetical protein